MTRMAFTGAFVTITAAVLVAVFAIQDGAPSCPPDAVGAPETDYTICYRPTNPTDAPSSIDSFPVTTDEKVSERLLVVGVGGLGAVFLLAVGVRARMDRADG